MKNLTARIYSHNQNLFPIAVRLRIPVDELDDKTTVWRCLGQWDGVAALGHVGKRFADIWAYGTYGDGPTSLKLVPTKAKIGWVPPPRLRPTAFYPETDEFTADPKNWVITLLNEGPGHQTFRYTAHKPGVRAWAEVTITNKCDYAHFAGKQVYSDPTREKMRLYDDHQPHISFPGAETVWFHEDPGEEEVFYVNTEINDGAGVQFSGYIGVNYFPVPDGAVDGCLFLDGEPATQGYLPGTEYSPPVARPSSGWFHDVAVVEMEQHPLGEVKYSGQTGDRPPFGRPGSEASNDPQFIDTMRRACAVETFRPIHHLEEDGTPFVPELHDEPKRFLTHNNKPSSQMGSGGYYYGRESDEGTNSGVTLGWWDYQGGEHMAYGLVIRRAIEQGCPIAIDTMDTMCTVLVRGVDYWIERHFGRTFCTLGMWAMVTEDDGLRQKCLDQLVYLATTRMEWLGDRRNVGSAVEDGPQPYGWMAGYQGEFDPPGPAASPMQNALATSVLPVAQALEDSGQATFAPEFWSRFRRMAEWLIDVAVYQNDAKVWQIYWAVAEDGRRREAQSDGLLLLNCAAGLVWLIKQPDTSPERRQKIGEMLGELWDGSRDSDVARYLSCYITRSELRYHSRR